VPVITVSQDAVTVTGGAGDDTFAGRTERSRIEGDAGNDLIPALGFGNIQHGGLGDDRIEASSAGRSFGDAGNDTITGLPDETVNFIEGGPGDDVLDGDPVDGAPFLSFVMYTTADSGVRVSLATEAAQAVGGGAGVDVVRHFTGIIGSPFGDTLTAGAATPQKLYGEAGDDRLQAGPEGDELSGGAGDDTLVGGAGADIALYAAEPFFGIVGATGSLTIDLRIAGPQDVGGGAGRDSFVSIEGVLAADFADTLTGSDGANTFYGRAGRDSISGLGGNDDLLGEDGADTVRGGDGDDRITDYIFSADDDDLHGNRGADTVVAGGGRDTLRGGQGDDSLAGQDGADFLAGDRGSDTLAGGDGADIFHAWSEAGLDRVIDFSAAQGDRVYLLPGAAPTTSQVGADTVIDFGGGNRMVLVGVQLSTLPAGWIFGA
jgi:Ca2+-binding RTX toxin-like protein